MHFNQCTLNNGDYMKMVTKFMILSLLSLFLLINSCDNKYETKNPEDVETMNSGKLDIVIDSQYSPLMDSTLKMYQKFYTKVKLNYSYVNAREAMSNLFNGKNRAVVVGRDYLKDEDSILSVYNIKSHLKMKIADDALVFFANPSFPTDTINKEMLEKYFVDKKVNFSQVGTANITPEFVISDNYSSTYQNFLKFITKNEKLQKNLFLAENIDKVKEKVMANENSIGIGYLSQLALDNRFKMLKMGYLDSTGLQIRPKTVHQSNVLRGYYPYKFPIYVYLLENRQNLPFWFASFLAKETQVQKYFLDKGIVPGFANITLKFEE
jgi:ABC-type phosphate transport system substrate-binding protein